MPWYVYRLRLENGRIYVGLTDNLERRWTEHQSGNGGKTTSDSRPIALIYSESLPDRSAAAKRERQLKRWSRAKKLALAAGRFGALHQLAKRHNPRPANHRTNFDHRHRDWIAIMPRYFSHVSCTFCASRIS